MRFGDFVNAMLGLFIFIICPIVIFKRIVEKLSKLVNVHRENKIKREREEERESIIEKYGVLIEKGVFRFKMARVILENPLLGSSLPYDSRPEIVSKGRELFVSLPIENLDNFQKDYNYYCIERKDEFAKYFEFEGENVTEWFSIENKDNYEEVFSGWGKYSYTYISFFGGVERNDKSEMDYEIMVVADEIIKRADK